MGESSEGLTKTYKMLAGETTLLQYCAAVLDLDVEDQVEDPDGAAQVDERCAGILQDAEHAANTSAGDSVATYQVSGVSYVRLAGTVAIGDDLVIGAATGRLIKFLPGSHTSGVDIVARALRAGVSGDIIPAMLSIPERYHT